jgi:copper chaperone CopZ
MCPWKSLLVSLALAAAAPAQTNRPNPVTVTFIVINVQCDLCVNSVTDAIRALPGVSAVSDLTPESQRVRVTFDPRLSSHHQVARAINDAREVHGLPYQARLRLRIPDYSKADNAARVEAVFARHAQWVQVFPTDRAKGEFLLMFLPLVPEPGKPAPRGWSLDDFRRPISDPPPKGLGLPLLLVDDAPSTPQ